MDARVLSLDPHTIGEIAESVRTLGREFGVAERGRAVADGMLARIEWVRERVRGRPRPRVFLTEWLDPPFAGGHWVPERVEAAGGKEVLGVAGVPSVPTTWEAVREAAPDLVILAPCGFDEARAEREARAIAPLRAFSCPVVAVNADRFFARPSPAIATGVEQLAEIFHGL